MGWLPSEEKRELENVEPVAVGDIDDVFAENEENAFVGFVALAESLPALPVANDDAMLDISELLCPGLKPVACGCNAEGVDVPFV